MHVFLLIFNAFSCFIHIPHLSSWVSGFGNVTNSTTPFTLFEYWLSNFACPVSTPHISSAKSLLFIVVVANTGLDSGRYRRGELADAWIHSCCLRHVCVQLRQLASLRLAVCFSSVHFLSTSKWSFPTCEVEQESSWDLEGQRHASVKLFYFKWHHCL